MREKPSIPARVIEAAPRVLAAQQHVSLADVLMAIGWLDPGAVTRWRTRQIATLESALSVDPEKLSLAIGVFTAWASTANLEPVVAVPLARSPGREELHASESSEREAAWRTQWLARDLSPKKRARLMDALTTPPDLVAFENRADWKCHRCEGQTLFSILEPEGPVCLDCVGLGDLVFLPSGNAKVTRDARKASTRQTVVVRWNRTRKRYDRIGYLVEQRALDRALGGDSAAR